jgi:hypothetical protein
MRVTIKLVVAIVVYSWICTKRKRLSIYLENVHQVVGDYYLKDKIVMYHY